MIFVILTRVVRGLATILLVATFVFVTVRLTGDPIRSLLPEGTPASIEEQYRQRWGLDQPIQEQYLHYLAGLLRGDFGQSYFEARPAMAVVLDRIPTTLALAIPAFFLSTVVGVTTGTIAALRRGRLLDKALTSVNVVLGALPPFALGVMLVLAFAVGLGWFHSSGSELPKDLILPMVAMATAPAAMLARMTRAAMCDALAMPCVEHAKALGVSAPRRVLQYAIPNALLPIVTLLGFDAAYLIAGSSVIEVLFGWPGVGRLFVQAVNQHDFAVVQCVVIVITTSVVVVFALTDVAYRWIDPRLRAGGTR